LQQRLGLRFVTDGEFRRRSYHRISGRYRPFAAPARIFDRGGGGAAKRRCFCAPSSASIQTDKRWATA
jgi:hypothetical protein